MTVKSMTRKEFMDALERVVQPDQATKEKYRLELKIKFGGEPKEPKPKPVSKYERIHQAVTKIEVAGEWMRVENIPDQETIKSIKQALYNRFPYHEHTAWKFEFRVTDDKGYHTLWVRKVADEKQTGVDH